MPGYLLGTQAFVDAVSNRTDDPVHRWVRDRDPDLDEIAVSAVSFMLFKRTVDHLNLPERGDWQVLFESAVKRFEAENRVRPVSLRIAVRAAELSGRQLKTTIGGRSAALGELGLLVLATALDEEFTLVDRRQYFHEVVEQKDGLIFVDPYA